MNLTVMYKINIGKIVVDALCFQMSETDRHSLDNATNQLNPLQMLLLYLMSFLKRHTLVAAECSDGVVFPHSNQPQKLRLD